MGRKGAQKHLKRLPAPKTFPIPRKLAKFTVKPSPGPHRVNTGIPLLIVIRDILKHANTGREAKQIIFNGQCKIDGREIRDYRFSVGLMDVLAIPDANERFRFLPHTGKMLLPHPISEEETNIKLAKIVKKSIVKDGKIQLNLHDGRNKLLLEEDLETVDLELYKVGSTIKITIPEQEIHDVFPLEPGVSTIVTAGRNVGLQGRLLEIEKQTGKGTAVLESAQGELFRTALDYIFVVGRNESEISLPA